MPLLVASKILPLALITTLLAAFWVTESKRFSDAVKGRVGMAITIAYCVVFLWLGWGVYLFRY